MLAGMPVHVCPKARTDDLEMLPTGVTVCPFCQANLAAEALDCAQKRITELEQQVATLNDKLTSIRALASSLAIIHSTDPEPDREDG